jgi:uncharacterized membrane protein YbhN (UPF0104 family)
VHAVLDAIGVFVHHLAAVRWEPLGYAIGCQLLKLVAISRAWRNVVADAYPEAHVPWLRLFGAYVAGTGVNAIVPARGGEVAKLAMAKRAVPEATYTTLAATVVLLTLFDGVVAGALVVWAIAHGILPGLDVLPDLPSFDFGWFFRHPRLGIAIAAAALVLLALVIVWAARRIEQFWGRVRQGFAVTKRKPRYLRRVVLWQLVDWSLRLATVFWLLRAFSLPATLHNALVVQVTQSLSTIFPFSPSGIGTEQALLLYVFRGAASRTVLLSFSVGMRITLTIVNVVLGFTSILLTFRTLRWRRQPEPESPAAQTGG